MEPIEYQGTIEQFLCEKATVNHVPINAILELRMKGYQPSRNLLKSLQPEISSNTFIAIAKIFEMDEMLKGFKNITVPQTLSKTDNKNMGLKPN